ncbi:hypothetical protein PSECIP111951_00189 [Pseudoalteromonas holothuriae]|uniref:Uncharacterized protein n=1 Tax=Pseudoalteromonas holothuriae TaxID=2963714 RepID=A0A9W4QT91_9GAMM|nr:MULTISPECIES: hypothetical protein [unclassified Pseudoalteromonas]CAH9050425.1 hypothetical protein PSECIP111951_00189 [Pseudoalteromonas sp. CIP111951]CAH9052261.1 hypothetical protein PSECIP111854_00931 [Pseudoalteromonas sp. CIP111854]
MTIKTNTNSIDIYKKYYVERDYEQIDLFQLLKDKFEIESVLYPGSYVHISPAFIFPHVVFIDSDKQANKFFKDYKYISYIIDRKVYSADPDVTFYAQDYTIPIPKLENQFDLLVSQYAGFISDTCKNYLKVNGYLLVNNSHGDAGLAAIDKDYKLVAAIKKSYNKYRLSISDLDAYFLPKKDVSINKESLHEARKGVDYKKTAPLYLFQRIS